MIPSEVGPPEHSFMLSPYMTFRPRMNGLLSVFGTISDPSLHLSPLFLMLLDHTFPFDYHHTECLGDFFPLHSPLKC